MESRSNDGRGIDRDPLSTARRRSDHGSVARAALHLRWQGRRTVRIRFAASAARYVQEKRMHASQQTELQTDGSAVVEFRLSNTTEVKAWVLSFGAAAEVLEPEELRDELQRTLIEARELYTRKLVNEPARAQLAKRTSS